MLVQCIGTTRCGYELFGPGPEKGRASELAETWARPAGSSGERRPSLERLLNRLCQGQKRTRVPPEQGRAGESLPAPPPAASPRIAQTRLENPRQSQPRPRPSSAHACRGPCPLRVSESDATQARPVPTRPSPGLSIGEGRPWVADYGGRLLGRRRAASLASGRARGATRPLAADRAPRCGTSALHSASLGRSERAVILPSGIRLSPQRQVGTRAATGCRDPRSRHQCLCSVTSVTVRPRQQALPDRIHHRRVGFVASVLPAGRQPACKDAAHQQSPHAGFTRCPWPA